jgi:hypothetical protein
MGDHGEHERESKIVFMAAVAMHAVILAACSCVISALDRDFGGNWRPFQLGVSGWLSGRNAKSLKSERRS